MQVEEWSGFIGAIHYPQERPRVLPPDLHLSLQVAEAEVEPLFTVVVKKCWL